MEIKKWSGKSPLLTLYKKSTPLFYKSGVLLIFIAELFVMYLIQNNFQSARLQVLGIILLAISLLVSSLSLSVFLKRIKKQTKIKDFLQNLT